MSVHTSVNRLTINDLKNKKNDGEKITMLTCYDYTMSRIIEACDIDMVLVGDSAANVMCGHQTTLPISLDEMIFLTRNVVRGNNHAFIVCDMPFGSYQISEEEAIRSAVRIMKETGVQGVKIEGGSEIHNLVRHLTQVGIPVCGHIGLTPQSINQLSGYGLQGKSETAAQKLINDAIDLEKAGCFCIVFEKIPAALAKRITAELQAITIGIGAGQDTDGQVLVLQDMLGMNDGFKPKFLRMFGTIGEDIKKAVSTYSQAVKMKDFPNESESY